MKRSHATNGREHTVTRVREQQAKPSHAHHQAVPGNLRMKRECREAALKRRCRLHAGGEAALGGAHMRSMCVTAGGGLPEHADRVSVQANFEICLKRGRSES